MADSCWTFHICCVLCGASFEVNNPDPSCECSRDRFEGTMIRRGITRGSGSSCCTSPLSARSAIRCGW